MNRLAIARIAAVLIGAAVLFGLQQGLGMSVYVAIPVAVIAYMAAKVGIALLWGVDPKAK